ncbi:MAG: AzlD domain-containing protein [Candidatus Pseudothioglobus sp.]
MTDINYLLLVILFMTAATYTTRLTPFVLFANHKETPMLTFIAKSTPPMVMTILLIYMLRGVNYLSFEIVYTFIAILVTVGFHLYRRNALLSIIAGTIVYMIAVQL